LAWVGVSISRLAVAEPRGIERLITRQMPWDEVRKLAFRRRTLTVDPKRMSESQPKKERLRFVTNSYHKYVVNLSALQIFDT
jgi:hypothetical protein